MGKVVTFPSSNVCRECACVFALATGCEYIDHTDGAPKTQPNEELFRDDDAGGLLCEIRRENTESLSGTQVRL